MFFDCTWLVVSLQVKFVTPEVALAGWEHRSLPERVAAGDQFSGCLKAGFSLWSIIDSGGNGWWRGVKQLRQKLPARTFVL